MTDPGGGDRRRVVAYVRVSTREQGISGLGLEAQCAEVRRWAEQHDAEIAAVFTDVESGRRDDRPELLRALNHCKLFGASLIVSKLDRLGRRAAFIARMMGVFEQHHVSFVSVTQQFNTASSMGRLVLNDLLSFA